MLKRPNPIDGVTYKLDTGYQKIYITLNHKIEDNKKIPIEVFIVAGKAGTELRNAYDSIAKCISTMLKNEVSLEQILKIFRGVRGDVIYWNNNKFTSVQDAIARLMKMEYMNINESNIKQNLSKDYSTKTYSTDNIEIKEISFTTTQCPDCGSTQLMHTEGCLKCICGWSRC